MKIEDRYKKFIEYFSEHRPTAESELHYSNTFELLVAVILSAQCTDKRVNTVTPALFKRFPTPYKMAESSPEELFEFIKNVTYPNNKSKHLVAMAKLLVENYNGIIPASIDELQKLPGVGRKTANVIAIVAFNIPAMPVDTHVFRVAARIGLTLNAKTPLAAETQLVKYIPKETLNLAHHWLILHGRYVCIARKPKCKECGLISVCDYYLKLNSK